MYLYMHVNAHEIKILQSIKKESGCKECEVMYSLYSLQFHTILDCFLFFMAIINDV